MALSKTPGQRDDVVVSDQKQSSTSDAGASSHRLRAGSPVVVGIDGSSEARRGLLFAADLATTLHAELVVVHAYGLVGALGGWQAGEPERKQRINTAMDDEWCVPLADHAGLKWRSECVDGSAVGAILRVADEVDAGLIVLGSHGAGKSSEPLLGSTSHHVVRESNRPVVVVPPDDNHRHRRSGAGAMRAGVADS